MSDALTDIYRDEKFAKTSKEVFDLINSFPGLNKISVYFTVDHRKLAIKIAGKLESLPNRGYWGTYPDLWLCGKALHHLIEENNFPAIKCLLIGVRETLKRYWKEDDH